MIKFLTVFAVAVIGSSVFAANFSWAEFNKLKKAGDEKAVISYVDNSTLQKDGDIYHYCLAKAIVAVKKGEVNESTLANFILTFPDKVVANKDQQIICKVFLFNHAPWWCGFKTDLLNNDFEKFFNENSKFIDENKNNRYLQANIAGCFIKLKRYDVALECYKNVGDAYTYFYYSAMYEQSKVGDAITFLMDNPQYINSPQKLSGTINAIKRLSNPKYDNLVKPLLVVLNRTVYPNLQKGDAWKKPIVDLQLVMKTYGL